METESCESMRTIEDEGDRVQPPGDEIHEKGDPATAQHQKGMPSRGRGAALDRNSCLPTGLEVFLPPRALLDTMIQRIGGRCKACLAQAGTGDDDAFAFLP